MRRFFALALFAAALSAQNVEYGPFPFDLPPADAGVPYDYTLIPGLDEIIGTDAGVTFSGTASGNVPPGLTVSGATRVTGVPTRPGSYTFEIILRIAISGGGEQFSFRFTLVPTIVVRGNAAGGLSVEGGALSFNFTQGASVAETRTIRVTNKSAVARTVSASASSQSGRWLSVGGGASVPAYSSAGLAITANPAGLPPGVYSGSVDITATGGTERFSLAVVLAIAGSGQSVTVSQTGLTFEVQQGSPASPSQTFQIAGTTAGSTLGYDAIATTVLGGPWLRVSPASGNATAAAPSTVTASVSAAGLTAGQYYGQIEVRAAGATNSPRTVNVVLSVLAAGVNVAPLVYPTAVVLVQRPGAAVAPQTITVTNVSNATIPVTAALTFDGPNPGWFAARASAATAGPGQSVTVSITRESSVRLTPAVYNAELTLRLGATQRRIAVVLVIPPVPGNTAQGFSASASPRLDGCTPTKLVPVFATLGSVFSVVAAWPSALEMRVVDDCGDPLLRGAVTVSFSNGEAPLPLAAVGEGRWSGTFQPRAGVQNLVISADARTAEAPVLSGAAQIGGSAANNATTPVISAGGVVSAAALVSNAPLAPGSSVSIYGKSMASGLTVSSGFPLPTDLSGTQVILSGKRLPLLFSSDGQINAVVPYDVPINVSQQLVVRRGNALSMPEAVVVAQSQPAVFTKNQSGSGEGIVVAARADGSQFLVAPGTPVGAGEVLIIYCSGLGPVAPPVTAGTAAPSAEPLARTTSPVTVTVGGKEATVLFAGLAPGFAGLYQINALLPTGVTPGGAVELVLSVAGQTSRAVTIAVR